VNGRAAEDEFEVPLDSSGAREPRSRGDAAPRRAARATSPDGSVAGGELVAAQFDARRIQAVVGREQRSLVPCFRAEAARSPEFRGEVPIEFVVGNDGRVARLWIDEPRFREGALRDCLVQALAAWRFEPFPGQRPTVSLAFGIGR
jgi:outer membrane biosynthesis protein TonB